MLIENATLEQVIAVWRANGSCPASSPQEVPSRKYPAERLAAHLFGYVGEIPEAQLQRADYEGIEPGTIVGQAGIELAYNRLLMGTDGNKMVVVNSVGRENRARRGRKRRRRGSRLQLTIDADVQKATEDGFAASGFNGAAVVLDPRNGEVLGVHEPARLRSQRFAAGIDRATWSALNTDELKPLQNRALQGRYSPGFDIQDGGRPRRARRRGHHARTSGCSAGAAQTFYGRYFKCWKKGGHGSIDLRHAIEQSCDVFFYTVGNMLGVDRINKWATLFGLGVKSNIDLPNELTGTGAVHAVEGAHSAKRNGTPVKRSRWRSARARYR